jgi:competence protein ComEC
MCYFKKDSASKNIGYGDCLIIRTIFNEVKPPQNPAEFNYKRYLFLHNIYHQAYSPSRNWKVLNVCKGNPVIRFCHNLRKQLLSIFKENKIKGDELAVASAIVLGYKDYLDQDLISAYASSGALHVLAVSGLHVGIIYVVLNSCLLFLDRTRYGKIIKVILLLFSLWFYAIITGLSPSVLRASVMFSCIVVAQSLRFHTNIFNTLFVCCFILLVYNPYLIMEVGFQLSFLAVMGIISIQPWLYDRWMPNNWLLDKIWTIITVSIAAQAATFPLGLLYFHQFPNYFLFSNLIVIPMSFLILCGGFVLFVLGRIPVIGMGVAKVYSWLVLSLNESVRLIEHLPGSIVEGISISVLETWLIYLAIICFMLLVHYHSIKYFYAASTILIFLFLLQVQEHIIQKKQRVFVVYNIPNVVAYDFIWGNKNMFMADSTLIKDKNRMLFHVKHNWWDRNVVPSF